MSFTDQYSLSESTVVDVLNMISNTKEEFFEYLIKSVNPNVTNQWDMVVDDAGLFNALLEVIDAKSFERFIKIRQAGESNKEINKRYVSYLLERINHSEVVKAVEIL
jgi:hypothetical protein